MFAALASLSLSTHGMGLPDGPTVSNHAWARSDLHLPPAEAAGALFGAARTLLEHPMETEGPMAWSRTRPCADGQTTMSFGTLAAGLFDAAVLRAGSVQRPRRTSSGCSSSSS